MLILTLAAPLFAQGRQVETFGFVVDHGFALSLSSKTDANGETISVSSGKLRPLVHNAKILATQGKARVTFLDLTPHAANPPFASDAWPTTMHVLDASTLMGSFYGETMLLGKARAVRSFSSFLSPANWAHLAVIPTSATDSILVACADLVATTTPKICTVSGVGGTLQTLAGGAFYTPGATSTTLTLGTFVVE